MKNGGRRPGAGRKPAVTTILKRLALERAGGEAEKSLQFCVEIRDDITAPKSLRLEAADKIMDRIWGKPKQAHEIGGFGGPIKFVIEKFNNEKKWEKNAS